MRSARALAVCLLVAGCADPVAPPEMTPGGLRVSAVLGPANDEAFARASAPRALRFPEDHGAHPAYRSEWWYLTSLLEAADGREFGVQWTLFRQALSPRPLGAGPWLTGQAYMGHFAVTDVAAGGHRHAVRLARGHPELAGVTTAPFAAWIEDWRLSGEHGPRGLDLALDANDGAFGASLRLAQTLPAILQGDAGLSRKGPDQASYYYSIPRLETTGTLTLDGETVAVTGRTWLDREWSTSVLDANLAGWDWFALQLDDGRDVMAFRLRRRDGRRDAFDYASVRDASGTRRLASSEFELEPIGAWRDGRGVEWPTAWRLRLPRGDGGVEQMTIEALVEDQVMDVGFRYWEGIVGVRSAGGELGRGYMELTGYGEE